VMEKLGISVEHVVRVAREIATKRS
jgi:hypothetical protein